MRLALSISIIFLIVAPVCAQTATQGDYCRSLTSTVEHGDALGRLCEYATTLRQRLPDIVCQRTAKTYYQDGLWQTVAAEVRHVNGRDSYRNIVRNGRPFKGATSELPGSWSEGEFGSLLGFIFDEGSQTRFAFEKSTTWKSKSALLFTFHVAQENNRAWFLEANHRRGYPGFKGKLWLDASSAMALRLEMDAEQLDKAAAAARKAGNAGAYEYSRNPGGKRFLMVSEKMSIEFANVHLADGSDFVLPAISEEYKCLSWDACFHDQVSFENCHKFGVESRILDDSP